MTALAFDTLKYVKQLTAANVPNEQAEAQAEALRVVLDATLRDQTKVAQEASERAVGELDTKTDRAISKLDAKIDRVHHELDAKIGLVRKDLALASSDLGGSIRLLQGILGILVAGVASLVLKAYF